MNPHDGMAPTSDEKMMGAIAHVFGPLAAIIVWAIQKDKSRFVKFQTLQALIFDVILIMAFGLIFACVFGIMFLGMSAAMFTALNNPSSRDGLEILFASPLVFPFAMFGCVFPFSLAIFILRLIAGISVLNGRNYHYPVIGKWLDNFLDS